MTHHTKPFTCILRFWLMMTAIFTGYAWDAEADVKRILRSDIPGFKRHISSSDLSVPSIATPPSEHTSQSCGAVMEGIETQFRVPKGLLYAIALVESGRKHPVTKKMVPWPWTINVEGHGYFFHTKEDAMAAVRKFQNQGKKSIDVGCMQVNLYHHKDAFADLNEAFSPHHNVKYAATFLSRLNQAKGGWHQAMAHYHSATPAFHVPYRERVLVAWNKVKKDPLLNIQEDSALLRRTLGDSSSIHAEESFTRGDTEKVQRLKRLVDYQKKRHMFTGNPSTVMSQEMPSARPRVYRVSRPNRSLQENTPVGQKVVRGNFKAFPKRTAPPRSQPLPGWVHQFKH